MTVVENKRLDALLSFTDDLVKSTHFLSKEEHLIFEACKNLYNYLYSVTKDPKNLMRLCVLYQNRYKRLPAEVIDVSFEAIKCAGQPDAVVYFCKSVLHNLSANDALSRLSEVKKLLSQKKNSADVVKVFEACLLWRAGDMDGYTCLLKDFLECKNKDFNPYVAIPVSTAWLHSYAPQVSACEKQKGPFHYKTMQPNYDPCYIISVSCDSGYFAKYGSYFLRSLASIQDNFYCHVSVLNEVDARVPDGRFVLANQNIGTKDNVGPISSALRFIHGYDFLTNVSCPLVVMDFDLVFKKSLKPVLKECRNFDAGLRTLSNVLPWEEITAGCAIFNPTENAKYFLDVVAGCLLNTLRLDVSQWWVDQNALECGARFSKKNGFLYKNIHNVLSQYAVIPTGSYDSKIAQLEAVK